MSLTTTRAGSWIWGVGNDWDKARAWTVGNGQTEVDEFLAPAGDIYEVAPHGLWGGQRTARKIPNFRSREKNSTQVREALIR